jgi:V/A-type H+/Na+-transporting ATPase subunit K
MALEFMAIGLIYAIVGAALAVFLPGAGSAIGVGIVGQGAAGAIAEDPEKFGKLIILQALPGTQGIYGLLAAFMILTKMGFPGPFVELSLESGMALFGAALPIAFVGLVSAIYQAKVALAGVNILVKKPEEMGKAIILSAMVETYAVLGLLATILLINNITV